MSVALLGRIIWHALERGMSSRFSSSVCSASHGRGLTSHQNRNTRLASCIALSARYLDHAAARSVSCARYYIAVRSLVALGFRAAKYPSLSGPCRLDGAAIDRTRNCDVHVPPLIKFGKSAHRHACMNLHCQRITSNRPPASTCHPRPPPIAPPSAS
jgi:hypothetical protein